MAVGLQHEKYLYDQAWVVQMFEMGCYKGETFPAESFIVKKLMRSSAKDNESISCKRNQIVNL